MKMLKGVITVTQIRQIVNGLGQTQPVTRVHAVCKTYTANALKFLLKSQHIGQTHYIHGTRRE